MFQGLASSLFWVGLISVAIYFGCLIYLRIWWAFYRRKNPLECSTSQEQIQ